MTHRLGGRGVTTVEVDPAVARRAGRALAACGLRPEVVAADGLAGHPPGARYDRVVATCGMRAVPAAWIRQTAPGGLIVAPWGTHYANRDTVVRLTVAPDGASACGHFTRAVEFMKARAQRLARPAHSAYLPDGFPGDAVATTTRLTAADGFADRFGDFAFAAGLRIPDCAWAADERDGDHSVWWYGLRDRSWAAVLFRAGSPSATVHQSGPRRLWDEVLTDRDEFRDGGTALFCLLHADGFAMYRVHGDEKKTVKIAKLTAVTPEAHIALWRVLLGMDLIEKVMTWTHPSDVLPYLLTDPRLVRTTLVEDALWLRILDVPAAMEARTYSSDLSVVLDITDRLLGGGGRYALDVCNGKARCVRTDAAADVHTELSVLGSLYMGVHRASAFATANRLRCSDDETVAQLDAAFATDIPAELGFGF